MVSPVIKVVPGELASDGLQVILDLLSGPVQRQSIFNGIGFGNPIIPEKIIKVTVQQGAIHIEEYAVEIKQIHLSLVIGWSNRWEAV